MSNSGNSNDATLVKKLIKAGRYVKLYNDEPLFVIDMKKYINQLILEDRVTNEHWNGRKFEVHSAWGEPKSRLLNKLNQIRNRYWYFTKLRE